MERMEIRAIKMTAEMWEKTQKLAQTRYCSASAVVREALAEYLGRHTPEVRRQTELDNVGKLEWDDWFDNHRTPLHNGGLPAPGTCDFCDNQLRLHGYR